ncbi:MAG TPA: cell division ATP-binding protein FtsE [Desulfobulbaceae bacterium]|nr:cell division ATP-binding protein FtsE [Desulfobulbaceae bacterium]
MIDLVKVSKTYLPDIQALSDVSLSVRKGEIVFLTGKSGAGKSTLLRLLTRMEKPTKGVIEVSGHDLNLISTVKLQILRRSIGFAFQDFKLLPERTVAENIAIAMEVSYTRPSVMQTRIRKLLQRLGLVEKHNTPTSGLSRGEQQRVAIARALANNPELILADEPTGNLDSETTEMVMALFRQYNQQGATLVIATHDTSIYQGTSHRVIELREGRIVARGDEEPEAEAPAPDPALAFADDLFSDE